ncbi:MAG: phosphate signaling complex protein PhoU [Pseudobdellovibrionaceae bacterium]
MERNMDGQLEDLKGLILLMGGYVEKALLLVSTALINKDSSLFPEVHLIEQKINQEQIQVDNACMGLLAKQSPVAKDLRLILSIIRINTDLERMGDQSVNIAYLGREYLLANTKHDLTDFFRMSEVSQQMVKISLDSFLRSDVGLAKKVLQMDDEVDFLKNKIFSEMVSYIKQNPQDVEPSLNLVIMARNLERLGDHATNIAEDVIFAYTGQDIRHGGRFGG